MPTDRARYWAIALAQNDGLLRSNIQLSNPQPLRREAICTPFPDPTKIRSAIRPFLQHRRVAKATVRRMSDFDVSQIEVLKRPQAPFFGKDSPAGIISIRTADPTNSLEAKLQGRYEFNACEVRLEGYVSGPTTEDLGFRIAGIFSDLKGDLKDITPSSSPFAPDEQIPYLRRIASWRFQPHRRLDYAGVRNRLTSRFPASRSTSSRNVSISQPPPAWPRP